MPRQPDLRSLSGGERQRVAIGRALLADPMALLLDEPLASLDEARKQEILPYLEKLVRTARIPILYVSHAREEIERARRHHRDAGWWSREIDRGN